MDTDKLTLDDILRIFSMEPHHAAGWYSPHYEDGEIGGRSRLSSMYVLLAGGRPLPLHKLAGVEVWHYHLGAPAEMTVTNGSRLHEVSVLGPDLLAGERPQLAIPAHSWHACRSLGEWTLLGCTMAPGYSPRGAVIVNADD